MTTKELFDKCKDLWGLEAQMLMLVEELNELSVATLHLLRKPRLPSYLDNFSEEIADVELMLAEIKYYFQNDLIIDKYRKMKEERLRKIVNK